MERIHIGRGTSNMGTFRVDEVRQGLLTGRFFPTDLGWRDGMEKWMPLSQFPDLEPPAPEEPESEAVPPLPAAELANAVPGELSIDREGLPWERRAEIGTPNAWVETLKLVLLEPSRAFSTMRRDGGLIEPMFFALIGGTIGGIFAVAYQELYKVSKGIHVTTEAAGLMIGACLLMPILIGLAVFLHSALVHVSLMVLGAANRPFETTFRTMCFAVGSTTFLQVIPGCGALVAGVWNLVALSIGIAKTHEIPTGKAVLAVLLPTIVCCGGVLLAVAAVIGGVSAAAR